MKSWCLLPVTAVILLANGFLLHKAGCFSPRAHTSTSSMRKAPRESLSSAAALRQARCQPHHWRDCMLAR